MSLRIALASSDGVVVNRHFGKADSFLVFEKENNDFNFIEKRSVVPCCNNGEHADGGFESVADSLSDCSAIIVSKIGTGAADYLNIRGFEVYEAPYKIQSVLKALSKETGV